MSQVCEEVFKGSSIPLAILYTACIAALRLYWLLEDYNDYSSAREIMCYFSHWEIPYNKQSMK